MVKSTEKKYITLYNILGIVQSIIFLNMISSQSIVTHKNKYAIMNMEKHM